MTKYYSVTIPIAGHAFMDGIEAESEEEAINIAVETVEKKHIEGWEPLTKVCQGNVVYSPSPWEASAEEA